MILKADGSVWATGENTYGQLGDGTTVGRNSFVRVVRSGQSYAHTRPRINASARRGHVHLVNLPMAHLLRVFARLFSSKPQPCANPNPHIHTGTFSHLPSLIPNKLARTLAPGMHLHRHRLMYPHSKLRITLITPFPIQTSRQIPDVQLFRAM